MRISEPRIATKGDRIEYSAVVDTSGDCRRLWYSCSNVTRISESSDAALAALLIPAMDFGEDIHLEGAASPRLVFNANGPLQAVLLRVIPRLKRIKIFAPRQYTATIHSDNPAAGVATGFSGGIDSYCVLADHHYTIMPPGFQLTTLLFNDVGAHGPNSANFSSHFDKMRTHAIKLGLPLIDTRSNVEAFYQDFSFQQTHSLRNASVALLWVRSARCARKC